MRRVLEGLFTAGILLATMYPLSAGAQQVQVSPANRTIAITTTESAERRADVASLHVGYHIYAADSAHAYAEAARLSAAIASALDKAGVVKEAVASDSQSTQPTQEYQNQNLTPEERVQRHFESQQSWTVKTNPQAVAAVLAVAVTAGANESGQIEWSLADDASLSAEAATKALAHAQVIASQMAKGLGTKIGNLLYASNQAEQVRPLPATFRGNVVMEQKAAPQMSLYAPLVTHSSTVSAIFAIE